jgi:hypothetical protein
MFPVLLDFGVKELPLLGPVRLLLTTYGFLSGITILAASTWFTMRGVSMASTRCSQNKTAIIAELGTRTPLREI